MVDIQYTIIPIDGHGHYFEVELLISKPNPAGQRIQMPNWIPGSYMTRDFAKNILSLHAFRLDHIQGFREPLHLVQTNSDTWEIKATDGPVLIQSKIYAFDNSVRTAFLDTERAFFNFSSLCFQVVNQTHKPIDCYLQNTPLTKAWEVITTLPSKKVDQRGFGLYYAPQYDALIDHPVSLGRFSKVGWQSFGIPHQIVFQGVIDSLNLTLMKEDLKAICDTHIAFFDPTNNAAPFTEYIFHVNVVGSGYGGLEHRSSTALICKRSDLPYSNQLAQANEIKAYQDFLGLCSHEYFHSWMVKKVQPLAFQPYRLNQRNFTKLLWLFEGFTSYYDDLQLFRSGRIDQKSYLQRILDTHHQVLKNPGRMHQSVAQSSFNAWTKYYLMDENTPNAVVSYYAKGSLIAFALDILIRDFSMETKSLDDVMRMLWQDHGADGDDVGVGLTENGLDKVLSKCLGSSFRPLWLSFKAAYIDGTQDIDVIQLMQSVGISLCVKKVTEAEKIQQSLGIRTLPHDGFIKVTHVLEGYLGQHAGLCPNDLIIALNDEKVNSANWTQLLTRYASKKFTLTVFRSDLLKKVSLQLPSKAALSDPKFQTYELS
jgi:predicted metalloprotease with PDZ domain